MIEDLFADSGSEPDFERFPVSEQVKSSKSEDDIASEADAESHDEIQMGGLDDADAAHQTDPNLPVFDQAYGPQISWTFTIISLYQLVENLILYNFAISSISFTYLVICICARGGS